MFPQKNLPKEATPLDEVISCLLTDLNSVDSDSEEYDKISDQYVKLMKLKAETEPKRGVTPDTWALIGANLAGILLIIGHERLHVISTKALGFIGKLR